MPATPPEDRSAATPGGEGGLPPATACSGANAGTYIYYYDARSNAPADANTATATLAAEYKYGPFGEVIRATGPMAKVNPFMFSTKFYDWETGLYYYGHRYYNPSTGRWPSRDPAEEDEGGPNLYCAFGNDPIDGLDVNGLYKFVFYPGWSQRDIDTFYAAVAVLKPNLRHAEHLINARLRILSDNLAHDCPNYMPTIRQYIFGQAVAQSIDADLDTDRLTILVKHLSSTTVNGDIRWDSAYNRWEMRLVSLSDSEVILHELSHIYGTDDGNGNPIDLSNLSLYNAHIFQKIEEGQTCGFETIEDAEWLRAGKPACCRPPAFSAVP